MVISDGLTLRAPPAPGGITGLLTGPLPIAAPTVGTAVRVMPDISPVVGVTGVRTVN